MIESEKKIGEILIEQGHINHQQLEEALTDQKVTGEKIGEVLIRKGWVGQEVLKTISVVSGVRVFDIDSFVVDSEAIDLIPVEFASMYKIVPVVKKGMTLVIGMIDPTNKNIINEVTQASGLRVEAILADAVDIQSAQNQCYGGSSDMKFIFSAKEKISQNDEANKTNRVMKLANKLIEEAVSIGASDIHIEPEEKRIGIRYRIDGLLRHHLFLPKELESSLSARFKVIANLDITEKRLPQDGRIVLKVINRDIDFRVSTCPTVSGENLVLRILDKGKMNIGLNNLGFPKHQLSGFEKLIKKPYGIVLVTGPSGSGKTTTLYSVLQKLNRESINIMTVEDPVEYQFPRVRQVQINPKAGLTFPSVLRSFLRQDPDIIMLGEIRDLPTTEIAIQAALTGHLVLSTLHTNDSSTAFTRLIDMGIEPFLVAGVISGVLSQRLIRKVCPDCRTEYQPSETLLKSFKMGNRVTSETKFMRGTGCKNCFNTGHKGRTSICEFLLVTPEIQKLVLNKASAEEIKNLARKQGMRTLREVAIDKVLAGITSPAEMMRVV